jgi:hypothetical protein
MKEFDEVKLGDIVIFRTVKLEVFVTSIRNIPPPMIVIDIERENTNKPMTSTDQSTTPLNPQSKIKVFCIWFSHYLNKYEKKWIFLDLLHVIKYEKEEQHFKIGDSVCLRNFNYILNLKSEIEKEQQKRKNSEDKSPPNALCNPYFKTILTFLSPKMIITGIEQINKKDLKPFRDNITNELKRNSPLTKIKCMWHDGSTGKYKEDWFAKEALVEIKKPTFTTGDETMAALQAIFPEQ